MITLWGRQYYTPTSQMRKLEDGDIDDTPVSAWTFTPSQFYHGQAMPTESSLIKVNPRACFTTPHSQPPCLAPLQCGKNIQPCRGQEVHQVSAVFQTCTRKDSDSCTLSKPEFLTFMNIELAAFTSTQKDPGALDHMMKKLELNCDGQLDVQEFLTVLVACP